MSLFTNQIIAITGHRPEGIPDEQWTKGAIKSTLADFTPKLVIQGMAAGVDLWAALAAGQLDIPFRAVRPWSGHRPRVSDEFTYRWCLKNAAENVDASPQETYPGPWVYHNRNKLMVDEADMVLAVWSGKEKGGTYECVRYALSKEKPIYVINPVTKEVEGFLP